MAMVKASRMGLILSVLTLVFALVVTASSTYAWFAMNSTVSATGMQVSVVADNTYLVITNTLTGNVDADDKFLGTVTTSTIAASEAGGDILPANLKADSTYDNMVWQTAAGTSTSNGAALGGYATIADTTNYVKKFTFYAGLNPDYSAVNASNLVVSGITVAKQDNAASDAFKNAINVCAVCGTNVRNFTTTTAGVFNLADNVLADEVLADGTPIQIDVYVYVNGDNENVTSANAAVALGGYTVSLNFDVTAGTL